MRRKRKESLARDDSSHPDVVALCRLPFQDAQLLVGALRTRGIRAMTPDYEATFREWEQTLFEVLVEKSQLEEARAAAAEFLPD